MDTIYLPAYIYAAAAIAALITAIVLAIKLIAAKKEKRRKMKITKIAAAVSAVFVPIMLSVSVCYLTGICICPNLIETDDLTGLDYRTCRDMYAEYYHLVVVKEVYSSDYPKGTIIDQSPQAGATFRSDLTPTIRCTVSAGVQMIAIPNVKGLDLDDAKTILISSGLSVETDYEYSENIPEGKVIYTSPPAGEKTEINSAVKVIVSKGAEPDNSE